MQFVDLKTQYEKLKADIDEGIRKVLHHGKFIMGPEVAELEEKLADYVGVKHCISVSSGTDALLIPLMAWGVGPGDAVFKVTAVGWVRSGVRAPRSITCQYSSTVVTASRKVTRAHTARPNCKITRFDHDGSTSILRLFMVFRRPGWPLPGP